MKWFREVQKILSFGQAENRSLFGVGAGMHLGRGDILLVEHVLTQMPECRVMVEYGCGAGLQTIYWGVAMAIRQGDVHVYNIRKPVYATYWPANVKLYRDQNPTRRVASDFSSDRPLIVIVDGGDRLPIVLHVAQIAPVGSSLFVHDWIQRRYPEFVKQASDNLTSHGWEMSYENAAAALASRFAVWRRIREHQEEEDHGGDWCEGAEYDDDHGGDWCDGKELTIE